MAQAKNADLTHSLGLSIDKDGVASAILWNGPAFKADIVNGTKIVAVDGLAYSRERIEAAVQAAADGKTPVRLLVERGGRSEEHTSELQSLMRISYALFCFKKKIIKN